MYTAPPRPTPGWMKWRTGRLGGPDIKPEGRSRRTLKARRFVPRSGTPLQSWNLHVHRCLCEGSQRRGFRGKPARVQWASEPRDKFFFPVWPPALAWPLVDGPLGRGRGGIVAARTFASLRLGQPVGQAVAKIFCGLLERRRQVVHLRGLKQVDYGKYRSCRRKDGAYGPHPPVPHPISLITLVGPGSGRRLPGCPALAVREIPVFRPGPVDRVPARRNVGIFRPLAGNWPCNRVFVSLAAPVPGRGTKSRTRDPEIGQIPPRGSFRVRIDTRGGRRSSAGCLASRTGTVRPRPERTFQPTAGRQQAGVSRFRATASARRRAAADAFPPPRSAMVGGADRKQAHGGGTSRIGRRPSRRAKFFVLGLTGVGLPPALARRRVRQRGSRVNRQPARWAAAGSSPRLPPGYKNRSRTALATWARPVSSRTSPRLYTPRPPGTVPAASRSPWLAENLV